MYLIDAENYTFIKRKVWDKSICVQKEHGAYTYYRNGKACEKVSVNSNIWMHSDFIYSDIYGNTFSDLPKTTYDQLNTIQKELQMSYEDIKIIVTSSKGDIMPFKSEDDAIAWIAEKLEAAPRLNFTMFKGYQAVEPTKPDLSKFIRKIED